MGAKYLLSYVRVQILREDTLEVASCSTDGTGFLGNAVNCLSITLSPPPLIHRNN